jgi:hypothetical protein
VDEENTSLANNANSGKDNLSAEELKPSETTPEASAAAPVAVPTTMTETSDRVVRFVMTDNTPAYEQADAKSQQVGVYNSGDPVVVKLSGEWAEVSENYFVMVSSLSEKLVPRKRVDQWAPKANVSAL